MCQVKWKNLTICLAMYVLSYYLARVIQFPRTNGIFRAIRLDNHAIFQVWDHWVKGTPLEIADASLLGDGRSLSDMELLKCVHFGLLCVQENPVDRPTMLDILVMLHDVDTNSFVAPSKPAFTFAHGGNTTSSSQGVAALSTNEVSISEFVPR